MAIFPVLLVLTGCNREANQPMRTTVPKTTTTVEKVDHRAAFTRAYHRYQVDVMMHALWYQGLKNVKAAESQVRADQGVGNLRRPTAAVFTPTGSIAAVEQCIYNHESGNPTEHSHPSSGSGMAQMIPSTWRKWSQLAGYGGYAYAYEAPASVQESVLTYTLTHGGAHNWDSSYGNDPCTESMP